jgi:two-component system KDP operon response regulator KdpE
VTHVLVVDDDPHILRTLRIHLAGHGYTVATAENGRDAIRLAAAERPDLVVLDLGLPDIDGTSVIAAVREDSTVPIIVLSARTDAADKVQALDAGADDYVTKPFGITELLARMRAAVRRSTQLAPNSTFDTRDAVVHTAAFTIDLVAKKVNRQGTELRLTPTQWAILEILVRQRGALVTQRRLLTEVWGPNYRTQTNYLRVYLAQLRQKLEPEPSRPRYLVTEPGMGYRFETPDDDPTDTSRRPKAETRTD